MMAPKLHVSVTREDGSFLVRGMASQPKTLEVFRQFRDERPAGRAVFTLLSSHDGRLRLRPSTGMLFEVEVMGQVARAPAFFGLLPARPEIALRSEEFTAENAESVVNALYRQRRAAFLALVKQEIAS